MGLARLLRRLLRQQGVELPFSLLTDRAILLLDLADDLADLDLVIAFGLIELDVLAVSFASGGQ